MTRLETTVVNGVCRAVLTEPEKLNPLSEVVCEDLCHLVRTLEDDLAIRVVVLSGAGRAFCSGADLRALRFSARPDEEPAKVNVGAWSDRRRRGGRWQRLLDRWEQLPQVTIARLHGPVVGGGALLAAACDIRLATDTVTVRIPEVALGLPLAWAGLPRLVREVGMPRTRDLVLSGEAIDAETALAWGFVTRLVPTAGIEAAESTLVQQLLAMPAGPTRMTKDALAAIGREHPSLNLGWAGADLITWAATEPESQQATQQYKAARL